MIFFCLIYNVSINNCPTATAMSLIFLLLMVFILDNSCRANWYYTSRRCQKLFLLMMNRALFPCKMTAGKIMILSIESFGTVNKTAIYHLQFSSLRSWFNEMTILFLKGCENFVVLSHYVPFPTMMVPVQSLCS